MTRISLTDRHAGPSRWRIVVLCFLVQNCAMGFGFGSFGPLLASTQQAFGISRGLAATGMSVVMLAIGGLSPFLGSFLQRVPVRTAMVVGALLGAAGYSGLAWATSFPVALVMYGLVGISISLCAILGPLILISRWFDENRGKILATVNLPIVLFATPYIVGAMLPSYGRTAVYGAMGTAFLLMAPLLLLLAERPPMATRDTVGKASVGPREGLASILKRPAFWLLSLGIGIMAGSGTGFVVHIVPFGIGKQMSLQSASALLSVYAGAGIAGTMLFGWICDRFGPPIALIVSASCQALLWWGLLHVEGPPLYALAGLLGICVVPLVTLHGAALSQMFDAGSVSRAMGYSYSIKLPFIFGVAPALGVLFDRLGQYAVPFTLMAGLLGVSSVCFYAMSLLMRRPRAPRLVTVRS